MKAFGHPGDSPHDIRARKFVARWDKQASPESEVRADAIRNKRPVWRWIYVCAGVHDRVPPGEEVDSDDTASAAESHHSGSNRSTRTGSHDSGSEHSDNSGARGGKYRSRWKKCGTGVQLHVRGHRTALRPYLTGNKFEITADDLTVAKVWQLHEHQDASPSQYVYLMFCRLLRLQVMERFRRFGAKSSGVQRGEFILHNCTNMLISHRS